MDSRTEAKQRAWAEAVQHGIKLFGLTNQDLSRAANAKNMDSAVTAWRKYVVDHLKPRHRKVVMEKHPDRGGTHEEFVRAQNAWEAITSDLFPRAMWRLARQPRPVPRPQSINVVRVSGNGVQVTVVQNGTGFTASTNSTTTGSVTWNDPFSTGGW